MHSDWSGVHTLIDIVFFLRLLISIKQQTLTASFPKVNYAGCIQHPLGNAKKRKKIKEKIRIKERKGKEKKGVN